MASNNQNDFALFDELNNTTNPQHNNHKQMIQNHPSNCVHNWRDCGDVGICTYCNLNIPFFVRFMSDEEITKLSSNDCCHYEWDIEEDEHSTTITKICSCCRVTFSFDKLDYYDLNYREPTFNPNDFE